MYVTGALPEVTEPASIELGYPRRAGDVAQVLIYSGSADFETATPVREQAVACTISIVGPASPSKCALIAAAFDQCLEMAAIDFGDVGTRRVRIQSGHQSIGSRPRNERIAPSRTRRGYAELDRAGYLLDACPAELLNSLVAHSLSAGLDV